VTEVGKDEMMDLVEMRKNINRRMTLEWAEEADKQVTVGVLIEVALDLGGEVQGNRRAGKRHSAATF
jgi:hypothetical protein